jgi:hypothetical protein
MSRKFKFYWNPIRITGAFHDVFRFMTSSLIVLRMRNVLSKSRRENQITHFMFGNSSPKIVPFMGEYRKTWWNHRGRRWQHGSALHAGLVRASTPIHTCTHASTHPRAHLHTQICNTYRFSTAIMVTIYVHCHSCLLLRRLNNSDVHIPWFKSRCIRYEKAEQMVPPVALSWGWCLHY